MPKQEHPYGNVSRKMQYISERKLNECRNLTMSIGFLTAFPMSLALMFGIRDMDAVLGSNLPSAEVFYQITGSKAITTFMMSLVTVVYFSKHVFYKS